MLASEAAANLTTRIDTPPAVLPRHRQRQDMPPPVPPQRADRQSRFGADAAASPELRTLSPVSGMDADALHRRAPEWAAPDLTARRAAGFLAQLYGQVGDGDPTTAPRRRASIVAYEAANRFGQRPPGHREGIAILPPLSSGRAVDLSV